MRRRAQAARSEPRTERPPPGRPRRRGGWAAPVALALALLATTAWPAPARAGEPQPSRDGDPAAFSPTHALVEVGEWLLDLTGLGDRDAPPEDDGDGTVSAHAPMGPLIDPDGFAPKDPKPGGRPHDR